ncbi:MAG: outer membrane beta-barrel protein, partial [Fidelibacterota bacterium]
MKKLSIFLIPLLVVSMVFAQSETGDWKTRARVGILGNLNTYLAFMDDNDNSGILSPGIGGFMDLQIGKFFALNLSMAYDQVKIDYPTVLTNNIMSLGLNGKIYPLPTLNFKPHLKLGFSVMSFSQENGYFNDSKISSFLTMGLGAEIPINKRLDIIAAVDHHITQDDIDHLPNVEQFLDDEFVSVSLGISYRLGVVKEKEEAPEPIKIEKPEVEEE